MGATRAARLPRGGHGPQGLGRYARDPLDRSPDSRRTLHGRTFRVPAGLGCLVALLAVPIAVLAGVLTGLRALFGPTRSAPVPGPDGAPPRPRSQAAIGATGFALCSLVEKMSLDEQFALEDARTAGIPIDTNASIESLLADAVGRGWVDRQGDRYAVTARGRSEAGALLRRMED